MYSQHKYHKLRNEEHSGSFVPRQNRARSSCYHSDQGSFQYSFPPSGFYHCSGNNNFQDERMEMREYLYGDNPETRQDNCTGRSQTTQREAPPMEDMHFQPPTNHASENLHSTLHNLNGEGHDYHFHRHRQTKKAEYLQPHNNYLKRAEYFSYPKPHRDTNKELHNCSSQNNIRYSMDDSIISPPRVSRHRPNRQYKHKEEKLVARRQSTSTQMVFPTQTQYRQRNMPKPNIPPPIHYRLHDHEQIGNPSLGIHRLRLPNELIHRLDHIVHGCDQYARTLEDGWFTDLYSLTKQDIALSEVPKLHKIAIPIVSFIKTAASQLYRVERSTIKMDKNQPHVVKYSGRHRGVELHHDKCDITMNIMLSRSSDYKGGGTYFPQAGRNVRLEFGEFLLHPGKAVHAGVEITEGIRFLMVIFADSSAELNYRC